MCHSVSCTLLHTRPWPPENRPHRGFVVRYGKTPCHPVSFLAAASLLLVLPAARVRTLCACALPLSLPLLPLPPVYFSIVYVSSTPSMLAGLAFFFRGSPARRLSGEYALPERVAAHGNRRASVQGVLVCGGAERLGQGREQQAAWVAGASDAACRAQTCALRALCRGGTLACSPRRAPRGPPSRCNRADMRLCRPRGLRRGAGRDGAAQRAQRAVSSRFMGELGASARTSSSCARTGAKPAGCSLPGAGAGRDPAIALSRLIPPPIAPASSAVVPRVERS